MLVYMTEEDYGDMVGGTSPVEVWASPESVQHSTWYREGQKVIRVKVTFETLKTPEDFREEIDAREKYNREQQERNERAAARAKQNTSW